jgi:hypothetical protein
VTEISRDTERERRGDAEIKLIGRNGDRGTRRKRKTL